MLVVFGVTIFTTSDFAKKKTWQDPIRRTVLFFFLSCFVFVDFFVVGCCLLLFFVVGCCLLFVVVCCFLLLVLGRFLSSIVCGRGV